MAIVGNAVCKVKSNDTVKVSGYAGNRAAALLQPAAHLPHYPVRHSLTCPVRIDHDGAADQL